MSGFDSSRLVLGLEGPIMDERQEVVDKCLTLGRRDIVKAYKIDSKIGSTEEYLKNIEANIPVYNSILDKWGFDTYNSIEDITSRITSDREIARNMQDGIKKGELPKPELWISSTGTTGEKKIFPFEMVADDYAKVLGVSFLKAGLNVDEKFGFLFGYAPSFDDKTNASEMAGRCLISSLEPTNGSIMVPYGYVSTALQSSDESFREKFREKFKEVLGDGGLIGLLTSDIVQIAAIAQNDSEIKEIMENLVLLGGGMNLEPEQYGFIEQRIGKSADDICNFYGACTGMWASNSFGDDGLQIASSKIGALLTKKDGLVPFHEASPEMIGYSFMSGPLPFHTVKDKLKIVCSDPVPVIDQFIGRGAQRIEREIDLKGARVKDLKRVKQKDLYLSVDMFVSHSLPDDDTMRAVLAKAKVNVSKAYGILSRGSDEKRGNFDVATIYLSQEDYKRLEEEKFVSVMEALRDDSRTSILHQSTGDMGVGAINFEPMDEGDNPRRELLKTFWIAREDYAIYHRLQDSSLEEWLKGYPELSLELLL